MMSKRETTKWYWRRVIYLVAGAAIGVTVMLLPALVHTMMGSVSPFNLEPTAPSVFSLEPPTSPIDIVVEFIWLALPAIFVILVLYWVAGRRTRWTGYNDAVKWTRR